VLSNTVTSCSSLWARDEVIYYNKATNINYVNNWSSSLYIRVCNLDLSEKQSDCFLGYLPILFASNFILAPNILRWCLALLKMCWALMRDLRFSRLWRWRQQDPPKRWYPTVTPHGVITQKTATWVLRPEYDEDDQLSFYKYRGQHLLLELNLRPVYRGKTQPFPDSFAVTRAKHQIADRHIQVECVTWVHVP